MFSPSFVSLPLTFRSDPFEIDRVIHEAASQTEK